MAQQDNETKSPKMTENWDPDRFPTSARPIFTSVAVLIGAIGLLCFFTYWLSDHSDEEIEKRKQEQKAKVEENLLADEQAEDLDQEP